MLFIHRIDTSANTVTVQRAGADTITGLGGVGITSFTIATAGATGVDMRSNGTSLWVYHQ